MKSKLFYTLPDNICLYFMKVSSSKSSSPSPNLPAKARAAQRKLSNGSSMKQSPIAKIPAKGPLRQRLHPGMLSAQDRATAHYGAVTGLKVTEDGMHLLSAGRGLFKLEL